MTAIGLTTTEAPGRSASRAPKPSVPLVALSSSVAVSAIALTWLALPTIAPGGGPLTILSWSFTVAVLGLLYPLGVAAARARGAGQAQRADDLVTARRRSSESRHLSWLTCGLCLAVIVVVGVLLFVTANDAAVRKTFLQTALMSQSAKDIFAAFGTNVVIFLVAEVLVLVWGLVLAIARLAPGSAGRPIRWLAILYIDTFRAVPAIIVIYLVGFGLPLTGFPVLSTLDPTSYAILALTLTYGAYVAEVYRAGIEGVHRSQVAAARSLGFGYGATLRHVVLPQGIRRIIPPLLNDFIGLQKDTALVGIIGTVEIFNQAKIYSANHFNLSSVTVVAVIFIVITIPQARVADYLVARQQRRAQGA